MTSPTPLGQLARDLIEAGFTNEAVAEIVRAQFPSAKLNGKGVSSIRWRMRQEGFQVLTCVQARRQNARLPSVDARMKAVREPILAPSFFAKVQGWIGMFA